MFFCVLLLFSLLLMKMNKFDKFFKNKGSVVLKTVCISEPTSKFCCSSLGEEFFIEKIPI